MSEEEASAEMRPCQDALQASSSASRSYSHATSTKKREEKLNTK